MKTFLKSTTATCGLYSVLFAAIALMMYTINENEACILFSASTVALILMTVHGLYKK